MIHNACQTVRRPPAYYRHLLAAELAPYGMTSSSGAASSPTGSGSTSPPSSTTKALPYLRADTACWNAYHGSGGNSSQADTGIPAVLEVDSSADESSTGISFETVQGNDVVTGEACAAVNSSQTTAATARVPTSAALGKAQRKEDDARPQVSVPKYMPSALRAAVPLLAEDWAYGAGGGAEDWDETLPLNAGDSSGSSSSKNNSNGQVTTVASAGGAEDSSMVAAASALREAHFPGGALDHNGSQVLVVCDKEMILRLPKDWSTLKNAT